MANLNSDISITKVVQETLLSGSGPYDNPLDIYSPGHRKFTNYAFGEQDVPDISGIIQNIDILKAGNELKIVTAKDFIRTFDPILTSDVTLEPQYSGLTVNLKFGKYNVITTDNQFKNF